jgi:hypothetical protein
MLPRFPLHFEVALQDLGGGPPEVARRFLSARHSKGPGQRGILARAFVFRGGAVSLPVSLRRVAQLAARSKFSGPHEQPYPRALSTPYVVIL